MNTFIIKAKSFYSSYKWLLMPIIPLVFFVFLLFFIFPARTNQSTNPQPTPTSIVNQVTIEISPQPSEATNPYGLDNEIQGIAFGKQDSLRGGTDNEDSGYGSLADDFADASINQKNLSDGSIQYEYQSDDTNRPHMQIVKNGVVLFRRNLMPSDTTIDYYSSYLQNPEYTSKGSNYYGQSAMIYASPTNGLAIVFDPQTKQVYEQYIFPATSVPVFLEKFGQDISAYEGPTPAP